MMVTLNLDFKFDTSLPVYNGGNQKMRFLATDITYEALVKEAIKASNWGFIYPEFKHAMPTSQRTGILHGQH